MSPMRGSIRGSVMSDVFRTPGGALGAALTLTFSVLAILAHVIAPTDPFASVGSPLTPPSRTHMLGTDDLGRDVFSGIVHGTRTSLTVTFAVIAIASIMGIAVGAVAGYRGGGLDDLLMRGTEAVQIVPRFFLAVIVIALFGPGSDRVVFVLALTSWPAIARVVRAETLSLSRREFIEAAHALG